MPVPSTRRKQKKKKKGENFERKNRIVSCQAKGARKGKQVNEGGAAAGKEN